jgi:hypothetical protein
LHKDKISICLHIQENLIYWLFIRGLRRCIRASLQLPGTTKRSVYEGKRSASGVSEKENLVDVTHNQWT